MATLVPLVFPAAPSGYAYFFQRSATSTAIATYSDPNGTASNGTGPVLLDANGMGPSGGTYVNEPAYVVIKTSNQTTLTSFYVVVGAESVDIRSNAMTGESVAGADGAAGARVKLSTAFDRVLTSFGATDWKTLLSGESTSVFVKDFFAKVGGLGIYNVKSTTYGAKGDGSTLDDTAIQNAINAAFTAGGGLVLLPKGNYRVQPGSLFPKPNVMIMGQGPEATKITLASSGNMFATTVTSGEGPMLIADMTLDGKTTTTAALIKSSATVNGYTPVRLHVENVRTVNAHVIEMNGGNSDLASGVSFNRCDFILPQSTRLIYSIDIANQSPLRFERCLVKFLGTASKLLDITGDRVLMRTPITFDACDFLPDSAIVVAAAVTASASLTTAASGPGIAFNGCSFNPVSSGGSYFTTILSCTAGTVRASLSRTIGYVAQPFVISGTGSIYLDVDDLTIDGSGSNNPLTGSGSGSIVYRGRKDFYPSGSSALCNSSARLTLGYSDYAAGQTLTTAALTGNYAIDPMYGRHVVTKTSGATCSLSVSGPTVDTAQAAPHLVRFKFTNSTGGACTLSGLGLPSAGVSVSNGSIFTAILMPDGTTYRIAGYTNGS